jgi:hypothetical protein
VVEHREDASDREAEESEDENREVGLEHRREKWPGPLLYTDIVTTCYIVLFRISKPNPDPSRRI